MSSSVALAESSLRVEPVRTGRQLDAFLKLPWRIYRGDPNWVPPLLAQQREMFDRRKYPFHRHAEVECFLALRGREVVGRIAAILNHQHNRAHGESAGFFGFFESVDDPEVAGALLATSGAWLRERGATVLRGPASFSSNEEWGLLIEGFDGPPVIMMTYNPPYYQRLLEDYGLLKARDLLAYWTDRTRTNLGQRAEFLPIVERIKKKGSLRVRPARLDHFDDDLAILKEIYNRAWQLNWGFVPMTDEEIAYTARQLKPLVVPELCLFAFAGDEPVGVAIAIPDYNRALIHANGRLFPFGIFKILWHTKVRKIRHFRLLILGVVPGYHRRGVDAVLMAELGQNLLRLGYEAGEFSWVLEDNQVLNNTFLAWGLEPYRRYRVYEAPLVSP